MAIHDKEAERFSKRLEMKSSWVLLNLSVLWPEELQPHLAYSRRLVHYCTQQARKSDGTAALVLFLLTFSARMCPVSGTMCEEMAVNKGEVGIVCLLTSNVYKTRQSVMIKSFKPSDYPEDVLECDWKSSEARFHCMHTQFRTQLIAIRPDRVLARLPKDRLENVTYRCQLVPPDPEPFTDCDICDPDDAKAVPRTEAAPGTLPTTLGHRGVGARRNEKPVSHSREPKPQVSVHSAGGQLENGGLVAAVVILSIIVFCLLLAIAAMMVFFLHYIQMIPGKNKTDKRKPEEANGFIA